MFNKFIINNFIYTIMFMFRNMFIRYIIFLQIIKCKLMDVLFDVTCKSLHFVGYKLNITSSNICANLYKV